MPDRLDAIDKRILYHLGRDARRTSATDIAEEFDVSPSTIRNRIRQLEDRGIITGYHAQIEYERVGGRLVNLYICSAPVPVREQKAREALEVPGVINVRELMRGTNNLHVMATGTDTSELTQIAHDLSERDIEIVDEALVESESFHPYGEFGPETEPIHTPTTDFRRLSGGAQVVELTVSERAGVTGQSLETLVQDEVLPHDGLVVSIERDGEMITPKGDTVLQANDVVTIFSREPLPGQVIESFTTAH